MNDTDIGSAKRAERDIAEAGSAGAHADARAVIWVISGFAAVTLLIDRLLSQLFG